MIEENKIDTYVETSCEIDMDKEEQISNIQQGFNEFIDSHMLLYTRIMSMEAEEELTFSEPGLLEKVKDLFRSTDNRIHTGYQRIHEFILKAEHVSSLDAGTIADAFLYKGKGEDRSNFFEKLADETGTEQPSPDSVREIEEGEEIEME